MSLILMTTLFYKEFLLQGEIWCWSLLGLKKGEQVLHCNGVAIEERKAGFTSVNELVTSELNYRK